MVETAKLVIARHACDGCATLTGRARRVLSAFAERERFRLQVDDKMNGVNERLCNARTARNLATMMHSASVERESERMRLDLRLIVFNATDATVALSRASRGVNVVNHPPA